MNKKAKLALAINLILVVNIVIGLYLAAQNNLSDIRLYTNESNVLCLIGSLLYAIFIVKNKEQKEIPYAVVFLRYVATVCLTLTILTVFTILPIMKSGSYLDNLIRYTTFASNFCFHIVSPILSFVSFVYFEADRRLNRKKTVFYSTAITITYALTLLALNLAGVTKGPYPFFVYNGTNTIPNVIASVAIIFMAYIISRFVLILNQKHTPRRVRKA